jgi:hypothetical protein
MEAIKTPKVGGAKRLRDFAKNIRKSKPSKKLKDLLIKRDDPKEERKKSAKPSRNKTEVDL